eukprot:6945857-Lingulodinium_polyedra.AAC.1
MDAAPRALRAGIRTPPRVLLRHLPPVGLRTHPFPMVLARKLDAYEQHMIATPRYIKLPPWQK